VYRTRVTTILAVTKGPLKRKPTDRTGWTAGRRLQ
jgi:hypothetical protein